MTKEQIESLNSLVEGVSNTVTAISDSLPERLSRQKLQGQLQGVIGALAQIQNQLTNASQSIVEEHSTRDSFFGTRTGMNLS